MSKKNMPHCYWVEAVYIMNRTPNAVVHDMTPEENFSKRKPNLAHLKVFGCILLFPTLQYWASIANESP